MITKLVVKDYVSKKCPYLTKNELNDKTLIELVKKIAPSMNDFKTILEMDDDEKDSNDDDNDSVVLDFEDLAKQYPNLRKELKGILNIENKNEVEKLVEKYTDNQLISNLSREFFENKYGKENCVRCDLDGNGGEIINQEFITKNTDDLLKEGKYKVYFEGQIDVNNLRARFDVLIKDDDGKYKLYEVKGTNDVCTHPKSDNTLDSKIKDKYLYDLLFQYYVYTKTNLVFSEIGFITTNRNFTISGDHYLPYGKELNDLFKFKTQINLKSGTRSILEYFKYELYSTGKHPQESIENLLDNINAIDKGTISEPNRHYECKKGGQCPLLMLCFSDAEDSNSLFKLAKWNLYGGNWRTTKDYFENGYTKITDITDKEMEEKHPQLLHKGELNEKINCSRLQIEFEKNNPPSRYAIEFEKLGKILKRDYLNKDIKHLIFFDFESFQNPLPLVKDSNPWKQVVSQYSMHIVNVDYDLSKHDFAKGIGGGITHKEFIGNPDIDRYENPSFNLYSTLMKQLTESNIELLSDNYRVVVFNKSFEKTRMKEFVEDLSSKVDSKLSEFVRKFNENVVDLLDFFTDGALYCRDFKGRGSLKVVQPVLTNDPEVLEYYKSIKLPFDFENSLDYHKGDTCLVYNGAICLDLYKSLLIRSHMGEADKGLKTEQLLKEALAYCKIDSWGTVIIFDIIKNIFNKIITL